MIPGALDPDVAFKLGSPVFVRQLSRPNHWTGKKGEHLSTDDQADVCYKNSFRDNKNEPSVWRLNNALELARFAIATNALNPSRSLDHKMSLIAFTESDLTQHGLEFCPSPADTVCTAANATHGHLIDEEGRVLSLIRTCIADQNRKPFKVTRSLLLDSVECLKTTGCYSVSDGPCDDCGGIETLVTVDPD